MTSFRKINRVLLADKIQTSVWVIAAYLAAIVLSLIPTAFNGELFSSHWSGYVMARALSWSGLALLLAFIFLTRASEKVYTTNKYRLIPVSDTKLYGANLFSSFVAFILVFLIPIIFMLLYYLFNVKTVNRIVNSSFAGLQANIWLFLLGILLVGIAGLLFWWTTVSLIHLLTTAISRALPANNQKFYKAVIYIVLIYLVVWMFGKVQNWFSQLAYLQYMLGSSSIYTQPMWTALLLFVLAVVISVVNVLLMNKQVETKQ
ncbi:ABC transporter permease protein [Ligilactobacillus salitolerans]|uniref:ABC transporter permease protein n=1 Tax=Ligilactobacillus salitolerans TaxID=1808352 RepID=A0A401IQH2_9LACO|nr:hypothetical protein [Ligilactobacillus salitolerans]GBG93782.1 ABC transporter permease protein [Ligilactobacillus salitolerans]